MSAKTSALKLEPVSVEELEELYQRSTVGDDIGQLAERVSRQLGYSVLKRELDSVTSQRDLLAVLREHGIPFYRPEDVRAYKDAQVEGATRRLNMTADGFFFSCALSSICLVGSLILGLFGFSTFIPFLVSFGAAVVTGIGTAMGWSALERTTAKWRSYSLREYSRAIPLSVIQLADKLYANNSKLEFTVEELSVNKRPLDPLLFVELGHASYCLAVWDEPGFHAKLTG